MDKTEGRFEASGPNMTATADVHSLMPTLFRYLDRHMVYYLLEFLHNQGTYNDGDLLRAKIDILKTTNMVDSAIDIHKSLYKSDIVPEDLASKRKEVLANMKSLQGDVAPLLEVLDNVPLVQSLRSSGVFNAAYLRHQHGIENEQVETLYGYAKFQFDCGNYGGAAEYLFHYRALSEDQDKVFAALWGKLACEILMQNWDVAMEDLMRLKELIDSRSFSGPLVALQQRTWLLHWSLFIFFNHENGKNLLTDLFFQERYMNVVQTTCPHLLRYLAAAVITNIANKPPGWRRQTLKELVKVIQLERYQYQDPITQFLEDLYVNFDFEGAQERLLECNNVLANDYFLMACLDDFMENSRLFVFETYCRIHQRIDVQLMGNKLGMSNEDAERWIVNLIRNARLDAKIDSEKGQVLIGTQYPTVYEQIIEKTKGIVFKTGMVSNGIFKAAAADVQNIS